MTVSLRGFTQMTAQGRSGTTVAWPSGTVVGDLGFVVTNGNSTLTSRGWTRVSGDALYKLLAAADIAAGLQVDDSLSGLAVYAGARGVGRTRWAMGPAGVTVEAGGAMHVHGYRDDSYGSTINPAGSRLGSVVGHGGYWNALWSILTVPGGYISLPGTDSNAEYDSWEILPVLTPGAPSLVSPATGIYVDAAAAIPLSWVPDGVQTAAKVKLTKVSDSSVLWLKADGTLTATETAITSATPAASINAGALTSGAAYDWQVVTANTLGYGTYSAKWRLTPIGRPVVTSVTVTSPAGSLAPSIAWTITPGLGSQAGYRVRLCPSADATPANPVWDSGVRSGSATSISAPNTTPWTNGAALYAWVEVVDAALPSIPTRDDATFAVSWTPPAAPTSVTAANQTSGPLQVTVSGIGAGYSQVQVQRSVDSGATWADLAARTSPASTEVFAAPLACYGVGARYRARASNIVSGIELWSDWRAMVYDFASTDTGAYLVSADGDSWIPVRITGDADRTEVQGISVSYGMSASVARVDIGPMQGEAGVITVLTNTQAERVALDAFLAAWPAFWIRWSPEWDGDTIRDVPALPVARSGEAHRARLDGREYSVMRETTVAWVAQ